MGTIVSTVRPSTTVLGFAGRRCSELPPTVVAYFAANLLMVALAIFANFRKGCEGHKSYTAAKAGGYVLNLNFFLVLIPMLAGVRECILRFGRHGGVMKLFEDKRTSHIAIAAMIWVGVSIHVAGHAWHYAAMEEADQEQGPCSQKVYEIWRGPTGIFLLFLLGMMSLTAMPCLRRAEKGFMHRLGGYSLFQKVHRLWPVVYAVLFVHGQHMTWGVLACLFFVYAMDRIVFYVPTVTVTATHNEWPRMATPTLRQNGGGRSSAGILACLCGGGQHPKFNPVVPDPVGSPTPQLEDADTSATSGASAQQAPRAQRIWRVIKIEMKRPFRFEAGQYVLIGHGGEFHPFTISSAPEAEKMTVHIQSTGDWCEALRLYFEQKAEAEEEASVQVRGPYTAPAVQVWGFKTIVLISGGIGVTPSMSILSSLEHRLSKGEDLPEKVYVLSVARTQEKVAFFESTFRDIAGGPARDIIKTIRIHITGQTMRDVENQGSNFSIEPDHPKWNEFFSELCGLSGDIGVFVCGPPSMIDKVGEMCNKHNESGPSFPRFHFRPELF